MYTIEFIQERLDSIQAEITALGDPKDQPNVRAMEETKEKLRVLTARKHQWWFALERHKNDYQATLTRWGLPLRVLQGAVEYLRTLPESEPVTNAIDHALSGKGVGTYNVYGPLKSAMVRVIHDTCTTDEAVNFPWNELRMIPWLQDRLRENREKWLSVLESLGDKDSAHRLSLRKSLPKLQQEINYLEGLKDGMSEGRFNESDYRPALTNALAERHKIRSELTTLGELL